MTNRKSGPIESTRDPHQRAKGPGRRRGPASDQTAKDGLTDDVDPDEAADPSTAGSQ